MSGSLGLIERVQPLYERIVDRSSCALASFDSAELYGLYRVFLNTIGEDYPAAQHR